MVFFDECTWPSLHIHPKYVSTKITLLLQSTQIESVGIEPGHEHSVGRNVVVNSITGAAVVIWQKVGSLHDIQNGNSQLPHPCILQLIQIICSIVRQICQSINLVPVISTITGSYMQMKILASFPENLNPGES